MEEGNTTQGSAAREPGWEEEGNPWERPLVLSLDGGGVRGLSSLYILRDIMRKVKNLDANHTDGRLESDDENLPLPCNYFDFIIGTSTGGLISLMLGRLRMGVDECIQEYWILSTKIFQRHIPRPFLYSRRAVHHAATEVLKRHCGCGGPKHGHEKVPCSLLRQYDYMEDLDGYGPSEYINATCKSAVVTVRDNGITTDFTGRRVKNRRSGDEATMLQRTYNHSSRGLQWGVELNPEELSRSNLTMAQACLCTTAAPMYFRKMCFEGKRYIDGGIAANNPALIAWAEAAQMSLPPRGTNFVNSARQSAIFPQGLVSIGTGRKRPASRFGGRLAFLSWLSFAKHNITDTRDNHLTTHQQANDHGAKYFRFDVPEGQDGATRDLSSIGLDECKKARLKSPRPTNYHDGSEGPLEKAAIEDQQLRDKVKDWAHRGKYDPSKYTYKTFEELRDRTIMYLHGDEDHPLENNGVKRPVQQSVEACARLLLDVSRARRRWGPDRWTRFRTFPGPRPVSTG